MHRCLAWHALLVVSFLLAGCGGPSTANVSGTVKYDGKPLPEGEIYFVAEEGKPPEILPIKNGEFSGKVTTGKRKIQIFAYREGKPPPPDTPIVPGAENKENYIPAEYNVNSTTFEEVKVAGPNNFVYNIVKK